MSDVIDRIKGNNLGSIEFVTSDNSKSKNDDPPFFNGSSFNEVKAYINKFCQYHGINPDDVYNNTSREYSRLKCELTYNLLEGGAYPSRAAKALQCDRQTVYYRAWSYANENGLPHVINALGVKNSGDIERLSHAWFCDKKFPNIVIKRANGALQWNDYMDDMLKRLDAEKLSQSQIAGVMSEVMGVPVNANQVAGRRNRLGLRRCD